MRLLVSFLVVRLTHVVVNECLVSLLNLCCLAETINRLIQSARLKHLEPNSRVNYGKVYIESDNQLVFLFLCSMSEIEKIMCVKGALLASIICAANRMETLSSSRAEQLNQMGDTAG